MVDEISGDHHTEPTDLALHHALLQRLRDRGFLSDPQVEAAFLAVPRHLFLPGVPLDIVYADEPIPTKKSEGIAISSSSQPTVMAIMLHQLGLRAGDRVLEIGAGTGYNAALMAHIVGPTGHVVTLDFDEDIVEDARNHLSAAGFTNVQVVRRDGALGYPEAGPYDRIILTVGAWDIAPAWIDQLRREGRLALPLALNGTIQKLVAFERANGFLESVSVQDGAFMPLRGTLAGPQVNFALGPKRDLLLAVGVPRSIDRESVYTTLTGSYIDVPVPIRASTDELWGGISLWLAVHAPTMCSLVATGEAAACRFVPSLFGTSSTFRTTMGLLEEGGLSLLALVPDESTRTNQTSLALTVRRFGQEAKSTEQLIELLNQWDRSGRLSTKVLRIEAYQAQELPPVPKHVVTIDKPRTRLVLRW